MQRPGVGAIIQHGDSASEVARPETTRANKRTNLESPGLAAPVTGPIRPRRVNRAWEGDVGRRRGLGSAGVRCSGSSRVRLYVKERGAVWPDRVVG